MKVGTRSILFGAHQFILHPIMVAIAWWKLYGFPSDIRLWVAFFVHDIGYWGKPNMDGEEGETHVELGAKIMGWLFDEYDSEWYDFSLYHSRFYAKKNNKHISRLCIADKYALCLEPWWLYLPRVWLSGEIKEYMSAAKNNDGKYVHMTLSTKSMRQWFKTVQEYLTEWVHQHKNGEIDNVTQV